MATPLAAAPTTKSTLLVLLTIAYLLFELSFNARLLDAAGGLPKQRTLDELEVFGRVLSGVGLSLILWRFMGATSQGTAAGIGRLIAIGVITIPVVFWAQRALLDWIVDSSTTQQRASAVLASQIPVALIWQAADIEGLALAPEALARPEGKTFLAVLPLLAFYSPDLLRAAHAQIDKLVTRVVRRQVGSAEEVYSKHYLPMANQLRSQFNNDYLPASAKMAAASSKQGSTEQLWRVYLDEVGRQPFTASSATPAQRASVINSLHKRGVNVPETWRLDDRDGFIAALPGHESGQRYSARMKEIFGPGTNLEPGLSWEAFSSHADVQKRVRAQLAAAYPNIPLTVKKIPLGAGVPEFHQVVYRPLIDSLEQRQIIRLRLPVSSYAQGRDNYEMGRRAMRAMVAAPIALSFSLFFGLTNLAGMVSACVRGSAVYRSVAKAVFISAVILIPLAISNQISNAQAYRALEDSLQRQSRPAAATLGWLIHAQPIYYALGNKLQFVPGSKAGE